MDKQIKKDVWTFDDIRWLPENCLKVLRAFVISQKIALTTDELKKALNFKTTKDFDGDRAFGATMATWSKFSKKELLVFPALALQNRKTKWAINKKYLSLVGQIVKEVEEYL